MNLKLWLLIGCLGIASLGIGQRKAFKFPTQVKKGDERSFTLEALEALELRKKGDRSNPVFSDIEIENRIHAITGRIPLRFNQAVKANIKAYTGRRRASTERIISRSMVYFPIFEEAFQRHNLPTDLKYLAIVESALNPHAVSPVGATGLWQFMKGTAKGLQLVINRQVDERKDPQASSDAAARYLMDLYNRYGDWGLAIAAYNCGPGRVNQAVKRSGISDYWECSSFLPKETRNYVPAFIAVAYIMNYYHLHNIYPEHPEYNLQVTDKARVFEQVSFKDISDVTGLTMEAIRFLNPAFKLDYIPATPKGYILTLPLLYMADFRAVVRGTSSMVFDDNSGIPYVSYEESLNKPKPAASTFIAAPTTTATTATSTTASVVGSGSTSLTESQSSESARQQFYYRVKSGDNLGRIAHKHGVSIQDIRNWNNIKGSLLLVGQELILYSDNKKQDYFKVPSSRNVDTDFALRTSAKPVRNPIPVSEPIVDGVELPVIETPVSKKTLSKLVKDYKIVQHKVIRGETIWSISKKYNISLKDLLEYNGFTADQKIYPGIQLQIPVKE